MPRSLQARITRTAISPRLAIKTFEKVAAARETVPEASLSTPVWLADVSTRWKPLAVPKTRFHDIRVVDETESTNADLLGEAKNGLGEGTVLVARHQTAGRGRQGRTWVDEPDAALLVSWSLRPNVETASLVPLVTGTAVVRALQSEYGVAVALKWPNDVLVPSHGHRKLAGILAEAVSIGSELSVVVGLGLNVEFSGDVPHEIAGTAVDLASVLPEKAHGLTIDRSRLLARLLVEVDRALGELERGGAEAALAAYRPLCSTLGQEVRFISSNGDVIGRAVDLDSAGGLIIQESADGRVTTVTAGDAHHL